MSLLPGFHKPSSFPEEALQIWKELNAKDVNNDYLHLVDRLPGGFLKMEDIHGNEYLLRSISNNNYLFQLYSVKNSAPLYPGYRDRNNVIMMINSIATDCFKETRGSIQKIFLQVNNGILIYPGAFNDFYGDVFLGYTRDNFQDNIAMIVLGFQGAIGGNIYLSVSYRDLITLPSDIVDLKNNVPYLKGTKMILKTIWELDVIDVNLSGTILLYKTFEDAVDDQIWYQNNEKNIIVIESSSEEFILTTFNNFIYSNKLIMTKDTTFKIQSTDTTISSLKISAEVEQIQVPYVPSIITCLDSFHGIIGTMDLRDAVLNESTLNVFFNIVIDADTGIIQSQGAFQDDCEGILLLSAEQYVLMTTKGLVVDGLLIGCEKLKLQVQKEEEL